MRIFLLLMIIFAIGCKRCPEIVKTEITTVYRDSIIKGATVYETLTETFLKDTTIYKIVVRKDTTGKAELRYWKDRFGALQIECEAKDSKVTTKEVVKTNNIVKIEKRMPWWGWGVLIVGGLMAIVSVVLYFLGKIT